MDWPSLSRASIACLLVAAVGVSSGCSGSSGTTSSDPIPDADPPTQAPPAEPPPTDDPAAPDAPPSVELSASEPVVGAGDSVALSWSSEHASACQASGGWSGERPTQGSVSVGPISQSTTFSLSCSGAGGNAVAMLSVSVLGVVTLSWQAPSENVDGTPLTDLSGYRIYFGEQSRWYTDELEVASISVTQQDVPLPSGAYYFAMTAIDGQGNESGYSNEVVRIVN